MTAGKRGPALPAGYVIRPYGADDAPSLLKVENRAAELFRAHGYPAIADNPLASAADFRSMIEDHDAWVVEHDGGTPVGYAVAGPRGDFLHLRELSVDPAHGRRGLGSALVWIVVEAAAGAHARGVSLTTFRAIPFNAPFYEKLGFAELPLDQAPQPLRLVFESEVPDGVDPGKRVLMVRRTMR